MKKILLCVLILLISVNVFAADVDIERLTEKANNGDVEAQFKLGDSYYYDDMGAKQDYKQAAYWYQKAANQGLASAQNALSLCYFEGNGVEQAHYWLQKAVEQKEGNALYNLGICYFKGLGVPQNKNLAYMFIYLGLTQNTDKVDFNDLTFQRLKLEMTTAEITEAEQMAVEWMERHR